MNFKLKVDPDSEWHGRSIGLINLKFNANMALTDIVWFQLQVGPFELQVGPFELQVGPLCYYKGNFWAMVVVKLCNQVLDNLRLKWANLRLKRAN